MAAATRWRMTPRHLAPTSAARSGITFADCWTTDPGMLDIDKMEVTLTVTTDGDGVVRRAVIAKDDEGRVNGNLRLRVFSERAVRAVMESAIVPNCRCRTTCWARSMS